MASNWQYLTEWYRLSLVKQPTFRDAITLVSPRNYVRRKRTKKFYTDDASLPRSGQCFWLVEANFPRGTNNQRHYPDLGMKFLSCARLSDYPASRVFSDSQTSFRGENSSGIAKCRLFCQGSMGWIILSWTMRCFDMNSSKPDETRKSGGRGSLGRARAVKRRKVSD